MRLIISNPLNIDSAKKQMSAMLEMHGKIDVSIEKYRINRSLEQNRLMWKWLSEIGAEIGETSAAMHKIYKQKFLIDIFVRDDKKYAEMIEAIGNIEEQTDRGKIVDQVVSLTSTRQCNIKQFREYLNNIQQHAQNELSIRLTLPELQGLI